MYWLMEVKKWGVPLILLLSIRVPQSLYCFIFIFLCTILRLKKERRIMARQEYIFLEHSEELSFARKRTSNLYTFSSQGIWYKIIHQFIFLSFHFVNFKHYVQLIIWCFRWETYNGRGNSVCHWKPPLWIYRKLKTWWTISWVPWTRGWVSWKKHYTI